LESRLNESKKQLNIYSKDKNNSHSREQIYCFRTAIISEFLAPGYDRYFINLHSKYSKSPVGWAAFDGNLLKELRESGSCSALDYSKALEEKMILHVPRYKLPNFISTIANLWESYKLNFPILKKEYKRKKYGFEIIVRHTKIHRNGFSSIIHAHVIVNNLGVDELEEKILKNYKLIIRIAVKEAQKNSNSIIARFLRVGFLRVSLFSRDMRKRNLVSPGLLSPLIGHIELKRLERIRMVQLADSKIIRISKEILFCVNRKHIV
ncbi:hypothetical protein, partial [Leptospira meyeri]|uniref:hypothetical protein n=1 Tax=Leptospira meyeri TaxID=29508 RepID=UPI0014383B1C